MSDIPAALIKTYRTAIYRIDAPDGIVTFYIDRYSPELVQIHHQAGVSTSAFITAYHPYSEPASQEGNEAAQQALLAELGARGYRWLGGAGEDAKGDWPAEPSVLVLGIPESEATELATQFRQNGYVFCDSNGVPRLVLTR